MNNAFELLNDLKCRTCIHLKICGQNLGGLDLTMAAADCKNYDDISGFMPPKKFWRLFDVPGFFDIVEYTLLEACYSEGELALVEGTTGRNWCTAGRAEFNKTVFFSKEAATAELNRLKEAHKNGTDNC